MDQNRSSRALETAWLEYALRLDPRERVVIPIHAVSSIERDDLRELRLHAYLPEQGFRVLGSLTALAEPLGLRSRPRAWRLWIQDFVIEKGLRGRGIGSQMLTMFLRMAKAEGCRCVAGEISGQDAIDGSVAHLIRFYERHGFTVSLHPEPGFVVATIRRDILQPRLWPAPRCRSTPGTPLSLRP